MLFLPDVSHDEEISVVTDVVVVCGVAVESVFGFVSVNDDETADNVEGMTKDGAKFDEIAVAGFETKPESDVVDSIAIDSDAAS